MYGWPVGTPGHTPVLVKAVLELLAPAPGETYVDCTAGLGGHAAAVAERVGPGGTVVLNDADPSNLDRARARVEAAAPGLRVVTLTGNFATLPRRLAEQSPPLVADMLLADLGFASTQVDDASRGLSFSRDGPLDMRLDPTLTTTAADLVASLPEAELARIVAEYGEDRNARGIARKLVAARATGPIQTTGRLADIVRSASPGRGRVRGIDPATRTFQALRIAVNDELGSLQALLDAIGRAGGAGRGERAGDRRWLADRARVAVISFHSLEDRPVKQSFAAWAARREAEPLTRRPVEAGPEEVAANPRARSAKLRAVRLTGT